MAVFWSNVSNKRNFSIPEMAETHITTHIIKEPSGRSMVRPLLSWKTPLQTSKILLIIQAINPKKMNK